ncbi:MULTISPECIES: hypothetical protein [unclassified Gordonia (in: high G+C Gram-positive bacteria)]|uniref:hypothetical protein n=1 Tax=unclassified Gordonia (in: high G+C Gram-positive bacteria) TaxID=2657482 RepID=UPI0007E9801C|nr:MULTISPECIES: hypothetical protein [unclassified Gordonia (in: high G+C Gram-positive bacteria)]OBC08616.1 hypothetical protein A5785_00185 [Gordonia sp. 852002-50395_SCH5434458]OBC10360.1 hypothetical protein A5786_05360 [Gordonia sp. 852002-50816_SCH5313054-a]OBC20307.1 hypothetical protein A5788_06550 [Gordonia sp. 852002-50816_SCH5313054-c]
MIPASEMKERFPGTTDGFWGQLRIQGNGPKFVKVGRKVFYRQEDIDVWVASNTLERTDQAAS